MSTVQPSSGSVACCSPCSGCSPQRAAHSKRSTTPSSRRLAPGDCMERGDRHKVVTTFGPIQSHDWVGSSFEEVRMKSWIDLNAQVSMHVGRGLTLGSVSRQRFDLAHSHPTLTAGYYHPRL